MKEIKVNDKIYYFDSDTFNVTIEQPESTFFLKEEDKTHQISKVVINVANACNLKCVYCYAEGGNYGTANKLMSHCTIDNVVRDLEFRGIETIDRLIIFGGEPFVNWDGFQYAVEKFSSLFQVNRIETVTNGTKAQEKQIDFIIAHNIFVTVSLDGPKNIHEQLRGKGTHDKILDFISKLQSNQYQNFEVAGTYTNKHQKSSISKNELRMFYENLNVKYNISEVFSRDKELSISKKATKEEVLDDIDKSIRYIIEGKSQKYINPISYDLLLSMIYKKRSENFCDDLNPARGLTYDIDGSLKSCFRFWGEGEEEKEALRRNKKDSFEECKNCWCKNMCKECPANMISEFYADSQLGFNHKECVKKEYFEHAIKRIIPLNHEELSQLVNNFNAFLHYA